MTLANPYDVATHKELNPALHEQLTSKAEAKPKPKRKSATRKAAAKKK